MVEKLIIIDNNTFLYIQIDKLIIYLRFKITISNKINKILTYFFIASNVTVVQTLQFKTQYFYVESISE